MARPTRISRRRTIPRVNTATAATATMVRTAIHASKGEPLAPFTNLKIGGRALFYAKPRSWDSAPAILRLINELELPCKIIGRGTNLLISDRDLDFGVIHILRMDGEVRIENTLVEADADVLLSECCRESFQNSLTGLETLEAIPGSIGGAAVMNAGAFGKSIFSFTKEVTVLNAEGAEITLKPSELEIGYRRTDIRKFGIVRRIKMSLKKGLKREIDIKAKEFLRKRDETQPWKARTAGSVFKNPEDGSAGKILEELGFKGKSKGDASFSLVHANFLINGGAATFEDAYSLVEEARSAALAKGCKLECEMEVWNCD